MSRLKQIEKEVSALIEEGMLLANTTGKTFTIDAFDMHFEPGSRLKNMADPDHEDYDYLEDYFVDNYPKGKWMSSSDYC